MSSPKIVYKEKIVHVPEYVTVEKIVHITPPDTERTIYDYPSFEGNTWGDLLPLIGEYKLTIDQCNAQTVRIWDYVDMQTPRDVRLEGTL